ncbi:MAG: helix-turn-helix domain-containing protein [Bacillota bacterium]
MLTIKEAAEYANKSESWVRQKVLSGEIKAQKTKFKYGKRWEISKKNIDDFLEQAKLEKEIIEVREIEEPISKEEFLKDLSETIKNQNEQLLDENRKLIKSKDLIDLENYKTFSEALKEQNELFIDKVRDEVVKTIKSQNKVILEQKKCIERQNEVLIQIKEQINENNKEKGLLTRIKNYLFG